MEWSSALFSTFAHFQAPVAAVVGMLYFGHYTMKPRADRGTHWQSIRGFW